MLQLNNNAASLLVERWKRANELKNVATSDYSAMLSTLSGMVVILSADVSMAFILRIGKVSDKLVEEWIESEKHLIVADDKFQPTRAYVV